MRSLFARKNELPEQAVEMTEPISRKLSHELAQAEFIGSAAIVTLTVTELVGHETAAKLLDLLDTLQEHGATNFIVDVQNVQMMDSVCLGSLVQALRNINRINGQIAMVNTDRSIQYLFKLTRLDKTFPICADVMVAMERLEKTSNSN